MSVGYLDRVPPHVIPTTGATLKGINITLDYDVVPAILTAYTSSVEDCGKDDGITASGYRASRGTVAAPAHIPFGTTIQIDNDFYTVTDRGGAIIVDRLGFYHIDVWLPSKEEVEKFGRKIKSIKIWRK